MSVHGTGLSRFGAIETLPCLLCEEECSLAPEYVALGGKQVCNACADVIANIFNKKHGGCYLTWDNGPRIRAGYQKQPIPEALRWEVFERDGFQCLSCSSQRFLRADHIVPESKGGPTSFENLQTLCRSCNSRKGVAAEVPE